MRRLPCSALNSNSREKSVNRSGSEAYASAFTCFCSSSSSPNGSISSVQGSIVTLFLLTSLKLCWWNILNGGRWSKEQLTCLLILKAIFQQVYGLPCFL